MVVESTALPTELSQIVLTQSAKVSQFAQLSPNLGTVKQRGSAYVRFSGNNRSRVVAEGAQKNNSSDSIDIVEVRPHTFVYQERVSRQFLTATEEDQLDITTAFIEQATSQLAVDFDYVVASGNQPGTSTSIPNVESFSRTVTARVDYDPDGVRDGVLSAYEALLDAEALVADTATDGVGATGLAYTPKLRSALRKEPDLFTPGAPIDPLGIPYVVIPSTGNLQAIVGDFSQFSWGVGVEDFRVIEYGDPDGRGDLANLNQVLLRIEVSYAWKIFDPSRFATVTTDQS